MKSYLMNLTYEIEIQPGETLTLPKSLVEQVGEGHWIISIQPKLNQDQVEKIRNHNAFLNGYASEDEGLYDDYLIG
jgi:hypothetical protein